jgi:uncharacterized protein
MLRGNDQIRAVARMADAFCGALLTLLIKAYRLFLAPFLGPQCRFYPSCSVYCEEAIHTHGCVKGVWLGLRRLGKCHPFHPGGVDPVPRLRGRLPESS